MRQDNKAKMISTVCAVLAALLAMILALVEGSSLFTSLFIYYLVVGLVYFTMKTELMQG